MYGWYIRSVIRRIRFACSAQKEKRKKKKEKRKKKKMPRIPQLHEYATSNSSTKVSLCGQILIFSTPCYRNSGRTPARKPQGQLKAYL